MVTHNSRTADSYAQFSREQALRQPLWIVSKTGQTGVSVIIIGGSWIVSFNKQRIDKELAREDS